MARKTVLLILHGSKHSVLGASARRPILGYKVATSEWELRRIRLPKLFGKYPKAPPEFHFGGKKRLF